MHPSYRLQRHVPCKQKEVRKDVVTSATSRTYDDFTCFSHFLYCEFFAVSSNGVYMRIPCYQFPLERQPRWIHFENNIGKENLIFLLAFTNSLLCALLIGIDCTEYGKIFPLA